MEGSSILLYLPLIINSIPGQGERTENAFGTRRSERVRQCIKVRSSLDGAFFERVLTTFVRLKCVFLAFARSKRVYISFARSEHVLQTFA